MAHRQQSISGAKNAWSGQPYCRPVFDIDWDKVFLTPQCRILSDVMFEGFIACTARFKSPHSISIGLRFKLWLGSSRTLHFFLLSHSLVDLLEYFECYESCMVHIRFSFIFGEITFSSSIHWYNREFTVDSMMSWPGPATQKQPQTMTFLPPCFAVEYEVLVLKCVSFFFVGPPCTPAMKIKLVQSLSDGRCTFFDINWGKSLLETSLSVLQSALRLNYLGRPDLAMLAVVLNVLHL